MNSLLYIYEHIYRIRYSDLNDFCFLLLCARSDAILSAMTEPGLQSPLFASLRSQRRTSLCPQ